MDYKDIPTDQLQRTFEKEKENILDILITHHSFHPLTIEKFLEDLREMDSELKRRREQG